MDINKMMDFLEKETIFLGRKFHGVFLKELINKRLTYCSRDVEKLTYSKGKNYVDYFGHNESYHNGSVSDKISLKIELNDEITDLIKNKLYKECKEKAKIEIEKELIEGYLLEHGI